MGQTVSVRTELTMGWGLVMGVTLRAAQSVLRLESELSGAAAGQSGKDREAYLQARNSVPGGLA